MAPLVHACSSCLSPGVARNPASLPGSLEPRDCVLIKTRLGTAFHKPRGSEKQTHKPRQELPFKSLPKTDVSQTGDSGIALRTPLNYQAISSLCKNNTFPFSSSSSFLSVRPPPPLIMKVATAFKINTWKDFGKEKGSGRRNTSGAS